MKKLYFLLLLLFSGLNLNATIHQVSIQNNAFSPQTFSASLNDTIRWTLINGTHNVTSLSVPGGAPAFTSPMLSVGGTTVFDYKVTVPGNYGYFCSIHGIGMAGGFSVSAFEDSDSDGFDSSVDCDDSNPAINPGATDVPDNGIDEDCSGSDASLTTDNDGDGFNSSVDCDDNNALVGTSSVAGSFTLSDDQPCANENFTLSLSNYFGTIDWRYSVDNGVTWIPLGANSDNYTTSVPNAGTPALLTAFVATGSCPEAMSNVNTIQIFANVDWFEDLDLDNFGNPNSILNTCHQPGGYVSNNTDCDDSNPMIYQGATEIPNNGIDENCDGSDLTSVTDNDGDGFDSTIDCDDNNSLIGTSAVAGIFTISNASPCLGNTFDVMLNNYIGTIDWKYSIDNGATWTSSGETTDNFTSTANGPTNVLIAAFVNYGTCLEDTSNIVLLQVLPPQAWYADMDGDSYGDANAMLMDCVQPTGYVSNSSDCDDSNSLINPQATDIPNNGIDEDCSGSDETQVLDNDGDGIANTSDCNDNDATIYPGAPELCDGLDNNCDGNIDEGLTTLTYYVDTDMDGFGTGTGIDMCADPGVGYSNNGGDCDDNNMILNPGATEICDGIDNNCDGNIDEGLTTVTYYVDTDMDGFGAGAGTDLCADPGAGFSTIDTDCDDNNTAVNPGANEICDGIDNNCDGTIDEGLLITYYTDADMDGFGAGTGSGLCADPGAGFSTIDTDCDDANTAINPGANEICDGIDNNCDGSTDEGLTTVTYYADTDMDGFGTGTGTDLCADPGAGFSTMDTDCDDAIAAINPGATEICDGIDNNCDGNTDEGLTTVTYYADTDMDGFGTGTGTDLCADPGAGFSTMDTDCDDVNADINPAALEIADNGIDEDCDGMDLLSALDENTVSVLNIYPNPGEGYVSIIFRENVQQASVKLLSALGQELIVRNVSDTDTLHIPTQELSSGVYYLVIHVDGKSSTFSWVKK